MPLPKDIKAKIDEFVKEHDTLTITERVALKAGAEFAIDFYEPKLKALAGKARQYAEAGCIDAYYSPNNGTEGDICLGELVDAVLDKESK